MRIIIYLLIGLCLKVNAQAQSLSSYIKQGLKNNPEIQAFDLKYKRVSEKIKEVKTLPNTKINGGFFFSEPETRTGSQIFKLSVNQSIPWFGTITSRENYVKSLAENSYEDIVIKKRQLALLISEVYYKLQSIKEKIQVLKENMKLLKTHKQFALAAVRVNKTTSVDVLQIEIRINEYVEMINILNQDFYTAKTNFNLLLNKNKNSEINLPEKFNINKSVLATQNTLDIHPELVKYDKLYESVLKSEVLNKKGGKPILNFGINYINVEKRPDLDFKDNGKDIIMPSIGLSIPIFNNKYKSITQQNILKLKEISALKQNRKNILTTKLQKYINNKKSASISLKTLKTNIKHTLTAENILLKTYQSEIVDIDKVLTIQELRLKFEFKKVNTVKSLLTQQAKINYLTKDFIIR